MTQTTTAPLPCDGPQDYCSAPPARPNTFPEEPVSDEAGKAIYDLIKWETT